MGMFPGVMGSGPASRIQALLMTTHSTFLVFVVTEGNLKTDLKAQSKGAPGAGAFP